MIKVLKNPITQTYIDFKELITRDNFLWGHAKENYAEGSHPAYFTHPFVLRPYANEIAPIPKIMCEYTNHAWNVVREILEYNDIHPNLIFRMNLNMTYAQDLKNQYSPVHTDHVFPHENLLIYFTGHKEGEGGQVIVGDGEGNDEEYYPEEDDAIIFPGNPHYMKIPKKGFRTALVTTFLSGYDYIPKMRGKEGQTGYE